MTKNKVEVVPKWKNRIVAHGEEAPDQLLANPKNWRIHPKAQQDALGGVLKQVGIVDTVLVNQRTGFVVDGHLRVAMAISAGQKTIPVTYVDLSEEEEALVLATLDPIAGLAVADREQLDALLQEIETDDEGLKALLEGLAGPGSDPDRSLEEIDLENLPVKPVWCLLAIPVPRLPEVKPGLDEIESMGIHVEYSDP